MNATQDPADLAVVVRDVRKEFRIPHHHVHTLKERILHPFRRTGFDTLEALKGVSFGVRRGEFFGIVGRNGSGKSTLLKCMAGIYRADAGEIWVDGRMSTFIELGVGFNPDLAAHDNIVLNAVMLGLSPQEARARADNVIAFAGLEPFTELKIKNYSSGMLVRLAFSVMVQVDADVLLIDEVLAVGDAAFQQKCFDEFNRIRDEGRTVLLVTHDMGAVRRFCDRAILLDRGELILEGRPGDVGSEYLQINFANEESLGDDALPDAEEAEEGRQGDGRASIEEAWFEDANGERVTVLPNGHPCAFAMRVVFRADVEDPSFGFLLQNGVGQNAFSAQSGLILDRSGSFAAGDEVTVRIRFENLFSPDRYFATPWVTRRGGGAAWIDNRARFASVVITGTNLNGAVVDMPFEVDMRRPLPTAEARLAARQASGAVEA